MTTQPFVRASIRSSFLSRQGMNGFLCRQYKSSLPHPHPKCSCVLWNSTPECPHFSSLRGFARRLDPIGRSRKRASCGVINDPPRYETVNVHLGQHPDARVAWSVRDRFDEKETRCLAQNRAAGFGAVRVELELHHVAVAKERHHHADV